MKKGLVDLAELRRNADKADFRGTTAYCFVKGNKIIKVYATEKSWEFDRILGKNVPNLSKYKADTIVFPLEYLYENKVICGEIQEYIDDKCIDESLNDTTKVNSLIDNYELTIQDLLTFSNILMRDLCEVNILYSDERGFHIIDTSEWSFGKDTSKNNIFRFNSVLARILLCYTEVPVYYIRNQFFLDNSVLENTNKYGNYGKNLYTLLELNINEKYHIVDLLYAYMSLYQNIYSKEMETLHDMKELTKILKKG